MKKLLLSIFIGSAAFFANGQAVTLVPIYGGEDTNPNDSVNSATGFGAFDDGVGAPGDWAFQEADEAGGNTYLELEGSSAGYYVWGVNNGKYSSTAVNEAFGYTGSDAGYLSFRVQVKNSDSRIKIGLMTTDGKTFGAEVNLEAYTVDAWTDVNILFTDFMEEDCGGCTAVPPTATDLANVGQINVILLVNSGCNPDGSVPGCTPEAPPGTWGTISRTAHIWVDDIHMSQTLLSPVPSISESPLSSTNKASENIASSKLYPNPSTHSSTVELNLKSVSDVKVTLTDMMGKEVMVIADEKTTTLNKPFNTSGLTQGVYTVNYFINGAPAKAELLMVK